MWYALKRLSLGLSLIVLASVLLLYSDRTHRSRGARGTATIAAVQQFRVAIVQPSSSPALEAGITGMQYGLSEAGFEEGHNLKIRRFNAEGDTGTANAIAHEVTSGDFDLIMTVSTPSLLNVVTANKEAKIPHVFALVTDPFAVGIGIDRADPLQHPKHLVGLGTMQPVEQSFRTAKQCLPELKTVGVIWNPAEANSEIVVKKAREVCPRMGITLVEAAIEKAADIGEAAHALTAKGVQAIWTGADTTVLVGIDQVIAAAKQARIPVLSVVPPQAAKGALFDLGADYGEVGRLAGLLAGRILKGTDPATIPIENVLPEQLILNTNALKELAEPWHFPPGLINQAQTIIDEQGVRELRPRKIRRPPPGRKFHLGIAYFREDADTDSCLRGLTDGLRELGFEQGRNLDLRKAQAGGDLSQIPAIMHKLDVQDIDLIVPISTPCVTAAASLVKSKPAVFTLCDDPIEAGAGKSFSNHLPHMTGIASFPPVAATAEMLKKLLPDIKRVGMVYHPSTGIKVPAAAREELTSRGITLEALTMEDSDDVSQAIKTLLAKNVETVWIADSKTAHRSVDAIVKATSQARIPVVLNDMNFAQRGVLACVAAGAYQSGHAAAAPIARVLMGENPKDIPIENLTVPRTYINPTVARDLQIVVPQELQQFTTRENDSATTAVQTRDARSTTAATDKPKALDRMWNINILEFVKVADCEECERGILDGLTSSGLVEGRDFTVKIRNAHGDMPTLSTMVDVAVSEGADMIITLSTPAFQAAMRGAGKLPIVCTYLADPVAAGGGKSTTDHLPNVTGTYTVSCFDQMIPIMRRIVPDLKRIGTVFVPSEVNNVVHKNALAVEAEKANLELIAVPASGSTEVADAALAMASRDIDAICQISGNLTGTAFTSIAQAAYSAPLPLFGFMTQQAVDGAAVVLARDFYDSGIQAGSMAAQIMRGTSPADIPFLLNDRTKLIINKTAAAKCNMTLPPELVKQAERVIE